MVEVEEVMGMNNCVNIGSIDGISSSITIAQGTTAKILIPVTDADGKPVNLANIEGGLCFTFGKQTGYPGDVTKRAGEPGSGCEIVTDPVGGLGEKHPGAENNALLVTLTAEETRITPGRIYVFGVWAFDEDGPVLLLQGEMEVVGTVWCGAE